MKGSKWLWLFFATLLILTAKVNQVNAEVVVGDQIDIYVGSNMQAEPAAVYESVNERFLVVWDERPEGRASIYGQLVNRDSSLYAGRIAICEAAEGQNAYGPKIAFDQSNQRFLVVWGDNHIHQPEWIQVAETYAQFINSDGSLSGENFTISPDPIEVGSAYPTSIILDPILNRFFVLMYLKRNIIGQFVNIDGSLIGDYFPITNFVSGYGVLGVSLGYDSNNGRFLVAYGNGDNSNIYGRVLNGDGTFYSAEFTIANTGGYIVSTPFDPVNNRFLAVFNMAWWLHKVQGQFVNADGSLYGDAITIFDYSDGGSAIFDSVNNKFSVVATYADTRGQLLNPDGSFFGSSFLVAPLPTYPPILAGDYLNIGTLAVWSVDLGYGTGRDIVGRLIQWINTPPVINPIGDKEVNSGELLTFEVSGYDLEEDPLSITSPDLPQGATLIDHGNGTAIFSWTPQDFVGAEAVINKKIINNNLPSPAQGNSLTKKYNITFKIGDGELTGEETIVITVRSKRIKVIPYLR